MKSFGDLNEQQVLALAISNEDEDNRIYRSFAGGLRASYPDTAAMYDKMAEEEIGHRDMLLELHRKKFGEFLPLIRRQDVKGFVRAGPSGSTARSGSTRCASSPRKWNSRPRGSTGARPKPRTMTPCANC